MSFRQFQLSVTWDWDMDLDLDTYIDVLPTVCTSYLSIVLRVTPIFKIYHNFYSAINRSNVELMSKW